MGTPTKNAEQYAVKLLSQLQEMFDEDCENHISIEELSEGDNLRDFLHALANIVPAHTYNKFTSEEVNTLEFNHIANKLVVQYLPKD